MSIEQTNQLILLTLNSVLMTLLSAAMLGGAWLRQNTLAQQLQQAKSRYRQLTRTSDIGLGQLSDLAVGVHQRHLKADLKKVRDLRQQLSHQYLWSHVGMLTLHGVLLLFGVSLFALALRSVLSVNGLISTALILFTVGSAGLLAGMGCILIDLAQGNSDGDDLGQSVGKAIAQIAYQWKPKKAFSLGNTLEKSPEKKAFSSAASSIARR